METMADQNIMMTEMENTDSPGEALVSLGTKTVTDIVTAVRDLPIMTEENTIFLVEHSKHLGQVMENTHMWRTDMQKKSIINDIQHPTIHSKFHQAILEQKVQFDQAMYLAKDFEMKKLEIEELECDLEELTDSKRDKIKERRIMLDLQFKQYELKQMQIAMKYRMDEVKGWQLIEEDLLQQMHDAGMSEDAIWQKGSEETKSMFFLTMNNLQGISKTTDSGSYNNLVSLACFTYKTAKQAGLLEEFKKEATPVQLDSIRWIESYLQQLEMAK